MLDFPHHRRWHQCDNKHHHNYFFILIKIVLITPFLLRTLPTKVFGRVMRKKAGIIRIPTIPGHRYELNFASALCPLQVRKLRGLIVTSPDVSVSHKQRRLFIEQNFDKRL